MPRKKTLQEQQNQLQKNLERKLAKLEKIQAELQASKDEVKQAEQALSKKERAIDTRKKCILAGIVLRRMNQEPGFMKTIADMLETGVYDEERELFEGLISQEPRGYSRTGKPKASPEHEPAPQPTQEPSRQTPPLTHQPEPTSQNPAMQFFSGNRDG